MPRFYVYCRFWPGFTAAFPFERFNHLPVDRIDGALRAAIEQEFGSRPELAERWRKLLEDEVHARWQERMKAYRPFTHGGAQILRRPHPKQGQLIHPVPKKGPIPTITTALGLHSALWVLGWTVGREGAWRTSARCFLVAADTREAAMDVVTGLNRQFGNSPMQARFGLVADGDMDRPARAACDLEIDDVCKTAAAPTPQPLPSNWLNWTLPPKPHVAEYARYALRLMQQLARACPEPAGPRPDVSERHRTPVVAEATPKASRTKSRVRDWTDEKLKGELSVLRRNAPEITLSQAAKEIGCHRSTLTRKYNADRLFRQWWDGNAVARPVEKSCHQQSHRTKAQRIQQNDGDDE